jgi:hypothetical protein
MKNLKHVSENNELAWTTNRKVYNQLYKRYLEHAPDGISCSYCPYHRGENDRRDFYGTSYSTTEDSNIEKQMKRPSWKLATKNRKQWMDKPKSYKIVREKLSRPWCEYTWVEIKF